MNVINFFISHIGWFVGAFFIVLFAIVGYFADKKEKENAPKKVDNKANNVVDDNVDNIYSINNNSDNSNVQNVEQPVVKESVSTPASMGGVDSIEGFYDGLDVEPEKSTEPADYSINVDGSNIFGNNSTDLEWSGSESETKEPVITEAPVVSSVSQEKPIDDSSSFESINMTFEDLERKNIDIINDSMGVTDSDDGFVSDYNVDDLDFFDNFNSVVQDNNIVQNFDVVQDPNIVQNSGSTLENNVIQDSGSTLENNIDSVNFGEENRTFDSFDSNSNNLFDVAIDSNNSFDSQNEFEQKNDNVVQSDSIANDSVVVGNESSDTVSTNIDNESSDTDEIWSL